MEHRLYTAKTPFDDDDDGSFRPDQHSDTSGACILMRKSSAVLDDVAGDEETISPVPFW